MADLVLPNQWAAREYQQPFMRHMMTGGLKRKRAVMVWHRRSGKDSTCFNFASIASQIRVGAIWHMLPTLNQGRKVIWDGIDREGRRMIDQAFPPEMREGPPNETEMKIRLAGGSIYQVMGSDNYDSLVGANPVGLIMSEYSVADPTAWDILRPILAENDGWAIFPYTPRGKNHGFSLYNMALSNPNWYCSRLTVDDTFRGDGSPVIGPDIIEEERRSGMSDEKILQEYYCSFEGGLEGAYYTNELNAADREGRIGDFPWNPQFRVQTWWDIGWRDKTAVIFTQRGADGKPVAVDYLQQRNKSLTEWIRELRTLPYDYDENHGPHDLEVHEFTTGRTRVESARMLDWDFEIVPKLPIQDGIDATRSMLRVMRFNRAKTGDLIDALYSYHREWDDNTMMFKDKPFHDWSSHGADAARYLSVGWVDGTASRFNTSARFKVVRAGVRQQGIYRGMR